MSHTSPFNPSPNPFPMPHHNKKNTMPLTRNGEYQNTHTHTPKSTHNNITISNSILPFSVPPPSSPIIQSAHPN